MVAADQALDLGLLAFAQLVGGVVDQAQQVTGRGAGVHRGVVAGAEPGPAVGEHHHALDGHPLAALVQIPQVISRPSDSGKLTESEFGTVTA
jgi:hypothetical protein